MRRKTLASIQLDWKAIRQALVKTEMWVSSIRIVPQLPIFRNIDIYVKKEETVRIAEGHHKIASLPYSHEMRNKHHTDILSALSDGSLVLSENLVGINPDLQDVIQQR